MSYEPKIGKQLVRMLMFQLYPEAETIYREYLQNSCDSILKAINIGYLKSNEACIDIKIDSYNNKIEILDNGTGIQSCFAEQILKDVAISQKLKENMSAGQFGIGRLVGGGYCKHLIFETSYEGEDKKSILIFDIDKTDFLLKEENELDASQLINEVTSFKTETAVKPNIEKNSDNEEREEDNKKGIKIETIPVTTPNKPKSINERLECLKTKLSQKEFSIVSNIMNILDSNLTKKTMNKIVSEIIRNLLK